MTEETTQTAPVSAPPTNQPAYHPTPAPSAGKPGPSGGKPLSEKDKGNYAIAMAVVVGLLIILATVWLASNSFNAAVDTTKQGYMNTSVKPNVPATNGTPTTPSEPTTPPSTEPTLPTIDLATRTFKGTANAPVWIFEIADYQCPYCADAAPAVNQVMAKYNDSVKLVFVHFPLNSIHPLAQKAAEAAECANDQGKFWEYHDKLFESRKLELADLKSQAKDLGLDTAKFNTCLDTGEKKTLIDAFVKLCTDSQITSTPTFIVNGEPMAERSFEAFDAKIQSILNPPRAVINTTGKPTWGNASAPVKIIEFSDFECPYCEMGYQTIKEVEKNYAGKVSVTFMHFPLSFHANAQKAAEASECAADQGKFWEYHDKLFTDRKLTVPELKSQAGELGLDTTKFNTCLDSGAKAAAVAADQAVGSANGITGTPGFFVNGVALKGYLPYEQFKKYIDDELVAIAAAKTNSTKK